LDKSLKKVGQKLDKSLKKVGQKLDKTMDYNNTTSFFDRNSSLPPPAEVDFIFEFLVPSVFLNGVGILGLVGNLLSIFILSRPQMKGSTNCILIGLATYDSILIMSR
jgi:hypothetical protein